MLLRMAKSERKRLVNFKKISRKICELLYKISFHVLLASQVPVEAE